MNIKHNFKQLWHFLLNSQMVKGTLTNHTLTRDVPLLERVKHLIKFAKKINGKWVYCFASHARFSYRAFHMMQRKRTHEQTGISQPISHSSWSVFEKEIIFLHVLLI